jgi:hypothetical protein
VNATSIFKQKCLETKTKLLRTDNIRMSDAAAAAGSAAALGRICF